MYTLNEPVSSLGPSITREASKQTYYTIRALVPRDRQEAAYAAYAYFRWVDDLLDGDLLSPQERLTFLNTQKELLSTCLQGRHPRDLIAEEWLLADLTQGPLRDEPGLRIYLQDMMAVMEFDVRRRHQRINSRELQEYSRRLATAVTEAVYTFIGESCGTPRTAERYMAADAAHMAHMLRDFHEDLEAGYINIPEEVLQGEKIDPSMVECEAVRSWVKGRVDTVRAYFNAGEVYLSSIENPRCRIAGALYAARFTGVLDAIEREGYLLRPDYHDCKNSRTLLRMAWESLRLAAKRPLSTRASPIRATSLGPMEQARTLQAEALKERG
jgi:phytoene/squalene synthetase